MGYYDSKEWTDDDYVPLRDRLKGRPRIKLALFDMMSKEMGDRQYGHYINVMCDLREQEEGAI